MLRPRKETDPLSNKRRSLAEQERLLSERMSKLHQQLSRGGEEDGPAKPAEPPVWRLGEDSPGRLGVDSAPSRRPDLARQRQRDKVIFILTMAALLLVVLIFLGLAHSHLKAL